MKEQLCVSIFQNGASETTKENFTRCWLGLVNQMEQAKDLLPPETN